jgi:uncharacterized protein (TIGR03118 family)
MHDSRWSHPRWLAIAMTLAGLLLVSWLAAADEHAQGFYRQANLVSDPNLAGVADFTDPSLLNPWGLAHSPTSPWWVADNGTGMSTLYDGQGVPQSLVVTIPPPAGSPEGTTAAPTGLVFNPTAGFVICQDPSSGCQDQPSGPSRFLFATEDGTIAGWNPTADATHALLAVDNSANAVDHLALGAVYKGLALGSTPDGTFLYVANFRDGVVEMYDATFTFVQAFTDPSLTPDASAPGFAPFGIQTLGDRLYVTFAMQDDQRHDDVKGPGLGFIDVFDLQGHFLQQLIAGNPLNAPWGMALAPHDFGRFSDALIVGNFGDGQINAFAPDTGAFLGPLTKRRGQGIAINGLWGLSFGNDGSAGKHNELFFTAGINNEMNGLFGKITAGEEDD